MASVATPGFRKEFIISENGNLSFSKDGSLVYFGAALPAPEKKADDDPTEEKAVVEVWSTKDDFIQPIQKITAARDRNRSFTATVSIASGKVTHIADDTMETATVSENPRYVVGSDNREYRRAQDYAEHDQDVYLFDTVAGTRKQLAKKVRGPYTWSPSGRYLLAFDGKDWNTISVPDGKMTNVTSGLSSKFWNEEDDHPDTPPSYGSAGWTQDGKYVLLYDHYDIWRVAPDGTRREEYHCRLRPRARSALPLCPRRHGYARALDRFLETAACSMRRTSTPGTRASSARRSMAAIRSSSS